MLKPFLLIYWMCLLFPSKYTLRYCEFCKNKSNTMCTYESGIVKSCINYTVIALTPKMQNVIIKLHNQLRNNVASGMEKRGDPGPQPPAANMFVLRWDNELAAIAQRWADHCLPEDLQNQQDDCKTTDRFQVSENIIEMTGDVQPIITERTITKLIMEWYNEVIHVNLTTITSFQRSSNNSNDSSHYSRMVWAASKYIGCVYASFIEHLLQIKMNYALDRLICNYGPTGNILDDSLYKAGEPCSDCETKCSKEYPALCDDEASIFNTNSASDYVMVTAATSFAIKKKQETVTRLPQYITKYFNNTPQTSDSDGSTDIRTKLFEISEIQQETTDDLVKWDETENNSDVNSVLADNHEGPKVLNVFERLLDYVHYLNQNLNVSRDKANAIVDAIEKNYRNDDNEIEFRRGKDSVETNNREITNTSTTLKPTKTTTTKITASNKTRNFNASKNTINKETMKTIPTSINTNNKTETTNSSKHTTSTVVQFRAESQRKNVSQEKESNNKIMAAGIELSANQTMKKKKEETKVSTIEIKSSTAEEDLLTAQSITQKSYNNCPFIQQSESIPRIRSFLREGDPCYCLHRINNCVSKVFTVKPYILMPILLFSIFL